MPSPRRKPPAFPPIFVANMTNNYLYLGFRTADKNGVWLAPKGQVGYYTVLKGLDLSDERVIKTLRNYGNNLKLYISVDFNKTLASELGISTTPWPTTPIPTTTPEL